MMPALQENLHAADRGEFVELLVELLQREHVVIVVLLRAVERAELAVDVADVRVVDVAIDDVGDDLRVRPALRRAVASSPSSFSGSS